MSWTISYIEPETVTYSLGDFLNSIERNGLPQIQGDFWQNSKGASKNVNQAQNHTFIEVTAACAIGQAALNLEVDFNALRTIINRQFKTKGRRGLVDAIIGRNDGHRWKYKTIAQYYRAKFKTRLNETFEIPRVISVEKDN